MTYNTKTLSKKDTYQLIERAKAGDEYAKEELIKNNTGLVKSIALKFTNAGYELDDLLQIGFIGLLKATDRFNTSYDVMFSTYAVPMILGEIRRHLRDDGKIKVSRQTKSGIKTLKTAQDEFTHKHNRAPRISELAEAMNITKDEVLNIIEADDALNHFESLDNVDRPEDIAVGSYIEEEEKNIDIINLKHLILTLKDKERQVIILRYFKDMTQKDVADKLNISQVQVSRIEKRVIEKMRKEF